VKGKTFITTFVSIVFAVAVILLIGVVTAKKTTNPHVSYSQCIKVENGQIVDDGFSLKDTTYFNPIGEKCIYTINISGDPEILSTVKVFTDVTLTDPVLDFDCASITMTTEELPVNDKGMYLTVDRRLNDSMEVKDGEYWLNYSFELEGVGGSQFNTGMVFITVGAIGAFVIFLLIILNRSVNSNKDYDERQLRMRGIAGLNAMVTAACILMGFGLVDITIGGIPFSVYQVAMTTVIVSMTVFILVSDINDAYFGFKQKRMAYTIICGGFAVFQFISFLFNGVLSTGKEGTGVFDNIFGDLAFVNLIIAVCLGVVSIEMIFKGISEKKAALKEAEDEES